MKKNKIIFCIVIGFCLIPIFVNAASGKVMVHYHNQLLANRKKTFDDVYNYMGSIGYTVEGHNNWNNDTILYTLDDYNILVMHTHGNEGLQAMNETYLVGKNGDGKTYKSVDQMPNDASQMKIAIYYGCKTGIPTWNTGDLPEETVKKGAQVALAWKVDTIVSEVNEWNRLFFEHAKSNSIVDSMRHADYWLREIKGNTAGDRMQLNRNEKGNIYGYVY